MNRLDARKLVSHFGGRGWMIALAVVAIWNWFSGGASAAEKPDFVFIMADDLGWADVGFHGGKTATPNLDRLAKDGVELARHYVYPVCSPTRSALLTGRYASRFGVVNPQNQRALPWETVTLAKALKSVGYDTAICGKWHLGSKLEWGPRKFGFDHSYGSLAGGVGPWDHHYKKGEFTDTWHRNDDLIQEEGHVTDLIAGEAVRWLGERGDRPFYLYVPFSAVHIPIREPQEYLDRVPSEITGGSLREYSACISHLDAAVGRILAALEKTGRADNTIVVFTSDNGGTTAGNNDAQYPADNYAPGPAGGNNIPLRAGKGTVYEGGVRVPTVVRWPARLKTNTFLPPVHITDWMPTFCSLAGFKPDRDLHWDGQDIMPFLTDEKFQEPRTIYIAGTNFRSQALRQGDWKLVVHHGQQNAADRVELFDLGEDPFEKSDLAKEFPGRVATMQAALAEASKSDRDAVAND